MARKIVALRPRQTKGSVEPSKKPLTLEDIAVTWTAGDAIHYVTGKTLARLICQLHYRSPNPAGHDTVGEAMMVPTYLRGLSYLVYPDAGDPSEDLDNDIRFTLSEFLDNAAALLKAEGADPKEYRLHVGPIPEEWTK
jgi:hypothetical protein